MEFIQENLSVDTGACIEVCVFLIFSDDDSGTMKVLQQQGDDDEPPPLPPKVCLGLHTCTPCKQTLHLKDHVWLKELRYGDFADFLSNHLGNLTHEKHYL